MSAATSQFAHGNATVPSVNGHRATEPGLAEPGRAEPAPRVTGQQPDIDMPAAEKAAEAFLRALGLDLSREGMADTPRRMAAAYRQLLTPRAFNLTTFANEEGYDELVLARDIPIRSMCEHHLLPFTGVAHVGYLPGERLLGLSKLARVVELFAYGPQVQERLTKQIVDWLDRHLLPRGVGVVIEAEHLCMTLRGVRASGSRTLTSAVSGALRDDPRSRAEFLALTGVTR